MKKDKKDNAFHLLHKWQAGKINRRDFLIGMAILAAGASIPVAFKFFWQNQRRDPAVFSEEEWMAIGILQEHLLPSEKNAPGAKEINARGYLQWVLKDPNYDVEEKQYIHDGIGWLNDSAMEIENQKFLALSVQRREMLLKEIAKENWGESWLSKNLSLIFEALFCDPVYGGNVDGVGWKWLEHRPGLPRPPANRRYGIL